MAKPHRKCSNGRLDRRRGFKNAIFATLSAFFDVLLFLLLVYAGRVLGVEDFGTFNSALALGSVVMFLSNLGLESLAIREISVDRAAAPALIGSILAWKSLVNVAILLVYAPIVYVLWPDPDTLLVVYVLCLAAMQRSFNLQMRAFLQGFERFGLESIMILLERSGLLILGVWVLLQGYGLIGLALVFWLTRLAGFLGYVFVLQTGVCSISFTFELRRIFTLQGIALPFWFALMIHGLHRQLDILLVTFLRTVAEVGLFGSAFKIYEGLLVVAATITSVMYPRLSNYFVTHRSRHHDYYDRTVKYMIAASFPLISIGVLFANKIIILLFGEEYRAAGPVLMLLLISLPLTFVTYAVITVLHSIGQQKYEMYMALSGLVSKCLIGLMLIPFFGIHGAALAVMTTLIIMVAVGSTRLYRFGYNLRRPAQNVAKMAVATVSITLILSLLDISNLFGALTVMAGLYIVALYSLGMVDQYERELLSTLNPLKHLRSIFGRRP
jgi:O-antigen/teichoic acid export membrane protein